LSETDHGLEFLLAFDGRIHRLQQGYWLKFEIKRGPVTECRPHGLSYSFTLHAPDGTRLIGFDNAHSAKPSGRGMRRAPRTHDHWHRTARDPGRPYRFVDAPTLIDDFFDAVEAELRSRGVRFAVIAEEEAR